MRSKPRGKRGKRLGKARPKAQRNAPDGAAALATRECRMAEQQGHATLIETTRTIEIKILRRQQYAYRSIAYMYSGNGAVLDSDSNEEGSNSDNEGKYIYFYEIVILTYFSKRVII